MNLALSSSSIDIYLPMKFQDNTLRGYGIFCLDRSKTFWTELPSLLLYLLSLKSWISSRAPLIWESIQGKLCLFMLPLKNGCKLSRYMHIYSCIPSHSEVPFIRTFAQVRLVLMSKGKYWRFCSKYFLDISFLLYFCLVRILFGWMQNIFMKNNNLVKLSVFLTGEAVFLSREIVGIYIVRVLVFLSVATVSILI